MEADDVDFIKNDSNYVLLKGVWNALTRDIDWNISQIINLPPELYGDTSFSIDPQIAFDPSGQKGWIAIDGDFINDGIAVYQPVFLSTTDGGATWSSPTFIDLTQYSTVMDALDPQGTGIPTTGFDADLAVDINGNAHFVSVIGSGSSHSIESGLELHVFDITNASGNWNAEDLARVYGFRGATGSDYSEDNRCQAAITPDGKRVVFIWLDTDTLLVDPYDVNLYTNSSPNVWACGFDAVMGTYSIAKNLTADSDFDAKAFNASLAPVTLRNTSDDATILPIVLLELNDDGTFASPADFFYMQGALIDDSEFTVGINTVTAPSINVSQNLPNPVNGQTIFNVTLPKASQVGVRVIDVVGQDVFALKTSNYSSGQHAIKMDCSKLTAGVYFYEVSAGNEKVTKKMIVE